MTLTLDLSFIPELEKRLAARACDAGVTSAEMALEVLCESLLSQAEIDALLDERDIAALNSVPPEGPPIPWAQVEAKLDAARTAPEAKLRREAA